MPISEQFARRLYPVLPRLATEYGTPFHVYDEAGFRATHRSMVEAFGANGFRQYFAVKALPNPVVLAALLSEGSGLDCASGAELELARRLGVAGPDIVFTSNNTSVADYEFALELGALVTFDDVSFLDRADRLPEVVSFRVSPHGLGAGSALMGDATHSKFGVPPSELVSGYRSAAKRGVARFGIHGMICANELSVERAAQAAQDVLAAGARVCAEAGIELEYVNIGGGMGIPYRPGDVAFDFDRFAALVIEARDRHFPRRPPDIVMECGRMVTGPHGVLVSRVINSMHKGRRLVGLDASMSALMRPALYNAYHHITLPFAPARPQGVFDVVGSLCENMDRFATDRPLPEPEVGDIALIHDTGAHGHAMGFTYNGRLRPAELMLTTAGEVVEIRRAETVDDYLATARWEPVALSLPEAVGA